MNYEFNDVKIRERGKLRVDFLFFFEKNKKSRFGFYFINDYFNYKNLR